MWFPMLEYSTLQTVKQQQQQQQKTTAVDRGKVKMLNCNLNLNLNCWMKWEYASPFFESNLTTFIKNLRM